MKLPNGENAFVDIEKLREYCLNPDHPRGKHKARVFLAATGITEADAEHLQAALLEAAGSEDAALGLEDDHGQRYVVEFEYEGPAGAARVNSAWIVRTDEDFPRLVSCYCL